MSRLQKLCNGPAALLFLSLLAMVRKIAPRGPCDPLVPEYCQLPFPNSFFTIPSPHTPTGVQVNFSTHSFPVDAFGRLTNLTEWNTFGKLQGLWAGLVCYACSQAPPHIPYL